MRCLSFNLTRSISHPLLTAFIFLNLPLHAQIFETVFSPTKTSTGSEIAYGNNMFVVIGRGDLGASSHDGYNWNKNFAPVGDAIAYGNGVFIVADGVRVTAGYEPVRLLTPDQSGVSVDSLAAGNGLFIAPGVYWGWCGGGPTCPYPFNDWRSTGGRTWTSTPPGNIPYQYVSDVLFANGYFYFLGYGLTNGQLPFGIRIFRTERSVEQWVKVYEKTGNFSGSSEHHIKFVNGELIATTSTAILTSRDGLDWKAFPVEEWRDLNAVIKTPAGYFGSGRRGIWQSQDLINWEFVLEGWYADMAYAEGTLIVLARSGKILRRNFEPRIRVWFDGGEVVVQAFATAGQVYFLESKASLSDQQWTVLQEFNNIGERSSLRLLNRWDLSTRYFRLRKK